MHIFGQQLLQTPLNCQLFLLKSWIYTQVNQRTTTTKKNRVVDFCQKILLVLAKRTLKLSRPSILSNSGNASLATVA